MTDSDLAAIIRQQGFEIERLTADLNILKRHYNLAPNAPLSREETIAAKDAEIERLKDEQRAVLKHVEELRAEIERLNCALRRGEV